MTWPLKKLRSLPDAEISFGNLLSCFLSMSLLLILGVGGWGVGGQWQDIGFVQVGYECDSPGISPTVNYTFFPNSLAFPLSKSCFLRLSWALTLPPPTCTCYWLLQNLRDFSYVLFHYVLSKYWMWLPEGCALCHLNKLCSFHSALVTWYRTINANKFPAE